MTVTPKTAAAQLEPEALRKLAGQSGPCITLLIPDRKPGGQEGSRRVVVNDLVRSAAALLHARKRDESAADLLAPLEEFARTADGGGGGKAVFCAPNFFHVAAAPGLDSAAAIVANYFRLAQFARTAFAPHDFYVLGLNRKNLRLLHYSQGRCEDVPWPAEIPQNEAAFDALDRPDRELAGQSSSGSSTGSMKAVRFGTGSDLEAKREYQHHFFLAIDRGLKRIVQNTPVLLAGVHEETLEYRRAARQCRLLEGLVEGNPDYVTPEEFAGAAARAAAEHYRATGDAVMAKYREMPDRGRTLEGVRDVLKAAAAGRVHQLCFAEGTEYPGDLQEPHSHEDLINAIAAETLKNGGDIFLLPKERLPAHSPVAAILRF